MVATANGMIDMKGERPRRRGEAVRMRADNEVPVTLVRRCRGGEETSEGRGVDDDNGGFRNKGGGVFSGKACAGVVEWVGRRYGQVAKGNILEKLIAECPGISWQVQQLGTGLQLMCSEILREVRRLDDLRL